MDVNESYLICYLSGVLTSWFFISFLLKRNIKNEKVVHSIIYKIYHNDYMPYLARIEGLINLIQIDYKTDYVTMARAEIHRFRLHLKEILKE